MNINNINDITTPQNAFMVNQYTETNDKTNCNPFNSPNNFGNYFDKCLKNNYCRSTFNNVLVYAIYL